VFQTLSLLNFIGQTLANDSVVVAD